MKTIKTTAVIVAIMMIGVVVSANAMIADDSDASGSIGTTKFYYTENLATYTAYTATGFNASDAISGQATLLSAMKSTVDNSYNKTYVNDYGPYVSINDEWGKITRTSDISEGSVWNVFVYTYDGDDNAGQWKVADLTLGFYKPFADYNRSYATANIALYYGPAVTSVPAGLPTTGLQDLTAVTETSTFEFTFEIMYGDEYKYLTGYGSDAALALIDAVGNNVTLNTVPGVSYGYLYTMYGLATSDDSGSWMWWHMMNNTLDDDTYVDSEYYLGFYTPLPDFDLSSNMISLTYY